MGRHVQNLVVTGVANMQPFGKWGSIIDLVEANGTVLRLHLSNFEREAIVNALAAGGPMPGEDLQLI